MNKEKTVNYYCWCGEPISSSAMLPMLPGASKVSQCKKCGSKSVVGIREEDGKD